MLPRRLAEISRAYGHVLELGGGRTALLSLLMIPLEPAVWRCFLLPKFCLPVCPWHLYSYFQSAVYALARREQACLRRPAGGIRVEEMIFLIPLASPSVSELRRNLSAIKPRDDSHTIPSAALL